MNRIFALFSDETKEKIISVFSSPQPELGGVEEIATTDERYQDFVGRIVDPFNLMNDL